jgi:hypothetical protein
MGAGGLVGRGARRLWVLLVILGFCTLVPSAKSDFDAVPDLEEIDTRWKSEEVSLRFMQTWTYLAMASQRAMAADELISNQTHLGTHNSFNAKGDGYRTSNDHGPNQVIAMIHQADIGARFLEVDVHDNDKFSNIGETDDMWVAHAWSSFNGTADNARRDWSEVAAELRQWILANPDAFLLIKIEDAASVYGDQTENHSTSIGQRYANFFGPMNVLAGSYTFRPDDRVALGRWPTPAEMRAMGKRVVFFDFLDDAFRPYSFRSLGGNSFWASSMTFPMDNHHDVEEIARDENDDYINDSLGNVSREANPPLATSHFASRDRENELRFFLLNGTRLGSGFSSNHYITSSEVAAAVRQNVNIIAVDQLLGQSAEDVGRPSYSILGPPLPTRWGAAFLDLRQGGARGSRLTSIIWSWREGDPAPMRCEPVDLWSLFTQHFTFEIPSRYTHDPEPARTNGRDVVCMATDATDRSDPTYWEEFGVGDLGTWHFRWKSVVPASERLRFLCVSRKKYLEAREDGYFTREHRFKLSERVDGLTDDEGRGFWHQGQAVCRAQDDSDLDSDDAWVFGAPVNGYQQVLASKAADPFRLTLGGHRDFVPEPVWINVSDLDRTGNWVVNRGPIADVRTPDTMDSVPEGSTGIVAQYSDSAEADADVAVYDPGSSGFARGDVLATSDGSTDPDVYRDTRIENGQSVGGYDALGHNWTVSRSDGLLPETTIPPLSAGIPGSPQEVVRPFTDDGVVTLKVIVNDETSSAPNGGAVDTATLEVTVENVAPSIESVVFSDTNGNAQNDFECHAEETLTVTFSDPGLLDTHSVEVNWGDGTVDQGGFGDLGRLASYTQEQGGGSFSVKHAYAGLGSFPLTIRVTDDDGGVGEWTFEATVIDTTPPVPSAIVLRRILWPPFGGLLPVGFVASATDTCDPSPVVTCAVYSNEAAGTPPLSPDALASSLTNLRLRSERTVTGSGRVYLMVVTAVDGSGNTAHACTTAIVPVWPTGLQIMHLRMMAALAEAQCADGQPGAGFQEPIASFGAGGN